MKYSKILLICFIVLFSCETTEPPIDEKPILNIPVDSVSITLDRNFFDCLTLTIETTHNKSFESLDLFRNTLDGDTLKVYASYVKNLKYEFIERDGIKPGTNYEYFAIRKDTSGVKDTSNLLGVKTFEIKSGNVSWDIHQFGDRYVIPGGIAANSINDIYLSAAFEAPVLHFDGERFEPVKGINFCRKIWKDKNGSFWFIYTDVARLENSHVLHLGCEVDTSGNITILDEVMFAHNWGIWGTSSENMYFVSAEGRIKHWNGTKGSFIENPASVNLVDIDGYDSDFIVAVGDNKEFDEIVVRSGTEWTLQQHTGRELNSIYVITRDDYIVAGSSMQRYTNGEVKEIYSSTGVFSLDIGGDVSNGNIFAVGYNEAISQYTGEKWISHSSQFTHLNMWHFSAVFVENEHIFAFGRNDTSAVLAIGTIE